MNSIITHAVNKFAVWNIVVVWLGAHARILSIPACHKDFRIALDDTF